MKKALFTLLALLTFAAAETQAMSYERARDEAWYLTDKMAYELNLTNEQYNLAYEINLDYLLNMHRSADLYGPYWRMRNDDLRYVLFDWQYNLFLARSYFYRPLLWLQGAWRLALYDRYRRDYFYFDRPVVVNVYRGRAGIARGPRSPYAGLMIRRGEGMRHAYYPDRPREWRGQDPGRIDRPHDARPNNWQRERPRQQEQTRPPRNSRREQTQQNGNVFARPNGGRANFGPQRQGSTTRQNEPRRQQAEPRTEQSTPRNQGGAPTIRNAQGNTNRAPQTRTPRPQTTSKAQQQPSNSRLGGSRSR